MIWAFRKLQNHCFFPMTLKKLNLLKAHFHSSGIKCFWHIYLGKNCNFNGTRGQITITYNISETEYCSMQSQWGVTNLCHFSWLFPATVMQSVTTEVNIIFLQCSIVCHFFLSGQKTFTDKVWNGSHNSSDHTLGLEAILNWKIIYFALNV